MKKQFQIRTVEDKNSPVTAGKPVKFDLTDLKTCKFLFGKEGKKIHSRLTRKQK